MNPSDVTVEMGLEAYRKTGLRPSDTVVYDADNNRGCLIGALCMAAGKKPAWDTETTLVMLFGRMSQSGWNLVAGFDAGCHAGASWVSGSPVCVREWSNGHPSEYVVWKCGHNHRTASGADHCWKLAERVADGYVPLAHQAPTDLTGLKADDSTRLYYGHTK